MQIILHGVEELGGDPCSNRDLGDFGSIRSVHVESGGAFSLKVEQRMNKLSNFPSCIGFIV